ncbi:hypothetical protein B0H11DRAFT_1902272 [Mycena galericulata]|nr:hypothetical protein B0H11DRAFT_1902272 [Mycena galericulata]
MDTLPNEVIDLIFNEVYDTDSLKACALVASTFRKSSQRILLRTVAFDFEINQTNRALWATLQKSPHIASNVRMLLLNLPPAEDAALEELECLLPELLTIFTQVPQLILNGPTDHYSWEDMRPGIADALADFIGHRPLQGLHILSIHELPVHLVPLIASSASTVLFMTGSVKGDIPHPLTDGALAVRPVSSMENLLLLNDFKTVGDVVVRPDFARYIANLRRLWVRPDPGYSSTIISATAQTLEEICFDCNGKSSPVHYFDVGGCKTPPLPELPSLRIASLRLDFEDNDMPWFFDTMRSLLASPAEEIIIYIFAPELYTLSRTFGALNSLFQRHSVLPRIRWCLNLDDATLLTKFVAAIEQGMPKVHEEKKFIFECTSDDGPILSWPSGSIILPMT